MRDFTKVSSTLWHSERFTNLATDDAKLAYLYMLTCEHQTSAGCFRLPDGYASADLRWPIERYTTARAELVKAGLILFDASAAVVMIKGWFRFNGPMNEKHLRGIRHILDRLPSPTIRAEAAAELEEAMASAAKGKAGELPGTSSERLAPKDWSGWKPRAA